RAHSGERRLRARASQRISRKSGGLPAEVGIKMISAGGLVAAHTCGARGDRDAPEHVSLVLRTVGLPDPAKGPSEGSMTLSWQNLAVYAPLLALVGYAAVTDL